MQNRAKVDPFIMESDLKEMLIRGFFLYLCKFSTPKPGISGKRCWGTSLSLRGMRSLTMDMRLLTKLVLQEKSLLV